MTVVGRGGFNVFVGYIFNFLLEEFFIFILFEALEGKKCWQFQYVIKSQKVDKYLK